MRLSRSKLIGIFCCGIVVGIILTLVASALFLPDDDEDAHQDVQRNARSQKMGQATLQGVQSAAQKNIRDRQMYEGFWIETVSDHPKPRIFILHNIITQTEAKHLKSLGLIKGMESALIIPYGQKDLVKSSTRTNTAAWLQFGQDAVVKRLEQILADVTQTTPEHGENLQILHYAGEQKFSEHHDYFDPDEDPPENFEPGGNRKATALIYLENAEVGGETEFSKLGLKLKPDVGDALLFFDLLPNGKIDKRTVHSGLPPTKGEKWVATKWIHEEVYQGSEVQQGALQVLSDANKVLRAPEQAIVEAKKVPKGSKVAMAT